MSSSPGAASSGSVADHGPTPATAGEAGTAGPGSGNSAASSSTSSAPLSGATKPQLGVFRFMHTFRNIDQVGEGFGLLSPMYSDDFGNHWQIKLYPLGRKCEFCGNALCRKQSNHMSVYLVAAGCENLVELDWWKCVQYRMQILVPDNNADAIVADGGDGGDNANEDGDNNDGAAAAAAGVATEIGEADSALPPQHEHLQAGHAKRRSVDVKPVSYTHLTLPTIYSV